METKVFINLPVKDLQQSMSFFQQLGYSFNPQFTDEKAACMIISDSSFAMLLTEEYFKTFTKKPISDAKQSTEVLVALGLPTREKVEETVKKAIELGGKLYAEPQDHGWLYQHSFEDLDGHQWELVYADASQIPQQ
jgi:uncharacterized protein